MLANDSVISTSSPHNILRWVTFSPILEYSYRKKKLYYPRKFCIGYKIVSRY